MSEISVWFFVLFFGLAAVFFACGLLVVGGLWWMSEKEDAREEKTMGALQSVLNELRKHEAEKHGGSQ